MSKYGYVGKDSDIPQQAFKANAGVLSVNDHLALSQEDKLTQYGQLELIETQTASDVANLEFTDLKEDIYNVHFLTGNLKWFDVVDLESGNVYHIAYLRMNANGTFTETKSTTSNHLRLTTGQQQNEKGNGYCYFYNLGDNGKYSSQSMHSTLENSANNYEAQFGGGQLPQGSVVDKIRLFDVNGDNIYGTFSLYGIKEYS
mgnify:CR=1 FL=1